MEREVITNKIISVRNGNKNDYLEIVKHFEPRIRAFIASRCYDRNLIQDLVQDAFIYAFEHLSDYQDGTNFQAWLYTIARMKVMAEHKRLAKRAKAHERYCNYLVSSMVPEEKEADNHYSALQLCLKETGEKAREFIKLRYKLNMSLKEICDYYGRTETWAKSYSFRLKQTLRDCIKNKLDRGALNNETA